jgi:hypothetical protein
MLGAGQLNSAACLHGRNVVVREAGKVHRNPIWVDHIFAVTQALGKLGGNAGRKKNGHGIPHWMSFAVFVPKIR